MPHYILGVDITYNTIVTIPMILHYNRKVRVALMVCVELPYRFNRQTLIIRTRIIIIIIELVVLVVVAILIIELVVLLVIFVKVFCDIATLQSTLATLSHFR
jgi:hypothetical protein